MTVKPLKKINIVKKCSKCQEHLIIELFPRNRSSKDGYGNYCKPCKNTYHKKYGNKFTKNYLKKEGYGIYSIISKSTKQVYFGKGWLNERKVDHFTKLTSSKHSNPVLQKIFDQYGKDNLVFNIIEKCESKFGTDRESYYLVQQYLRDKNKIINAKIDLR